MASSSLRPEHMAGVDLAELAPGASGRITGVTLDSRQVQPGDLYVGLHGARVHGAQFASQAKESGALAMLTDADGADLAHGVDLPVVVVDDPRSAMAPIAARVYGEPSRRMQMFGVTGTNGKTSTVFLLEAALAVLGRHVATIGTMGFRVDGEPLQTSRSTITTPESPDLQSLLAIMAEDGADAVAMEVSSHALALQRVDAVEFQVAGFTMFGVDHLDFHKTIEDYFEAKSRLFLGGRTKTAVINIDDPYGRRLADMVRADGHADVVSVSCTGEADYAVLGVETLPEGSSSVRASTPAGEVTFVVTMIGSFNVANAMTALAMVGAAGYDVSVAAQGLRNAQVPGRMQRIDLGPGQPHVIVDFAHTPQAIAAALEALPEGGRHIAVFGAGGDRDHGKRGPMGEAGVRGADVVVVTDDNPRTEDPATIRAAVLEGARGITGRADQVIDGGGRRDAIATALGLAREGDWVAILGKGHEKGQIVGETIHPFDDVEVVRDLAGRNA